MPSDNGDKRTAKSPTTGGPPPEQEHLPCPRCDSTNTKFCYYNNYNFSQPRHFCKSCRRYWTHGGTLRDIPVGGGSRKNAKRSHATTAPAVSSSSAREHLVGASPVLVSVAPGQTPSAPFVGSDVKPSVGLGGSFTSLLNNQGLSFLAVGGFGFGLGHGFDDVGFGLSRGLWALPALGDGGASVGAVGGAGGANVIGNAWPMGSGEGGFVGGGDCFSWPDLAISTPGNGLK